MHRMHKHDQRGDRHRKGRAVTDHNPVVCEIGRLGVSMKYLHDSLSGMMPTEGDTDPEFTTIVTAAKAHDLAAAVAELGLKVEVTPHNDTHVAGVVAWCPKCELGSRVVVTFGGVLCVEGYGSTGS